MQSNSPILALLKSEHSEDDVHSKDASEHSDVQF